MVSTAGSASEAFECLQTRRPDVLLCHIRMHGEDGCSPIRRVRLIQVGTSQDFVFSFLLDFSCFSLLCPLLINDSRSDLLFTTRITSFLFEFCLQLLIFVLSLGFAHSRACL